MKIIKTEAFERMLAENAGSVAQSIDQHLAELRPLNAIYERLTGQPYINLPDTGSGSNGLKVRKRSSLKRKGTGGRRKRRSAEDLQKQAKAMVDFIVSAKAEGRSGAEIKKKFPIGEGITIKNFISKYADEKVKTTGNKVNMRYFSMKG